VGNLQPLDLALASPDCISGCGRRMIRQRDTGYVLCTYHILMYLSSIRNLICVLFIYRVPARNKIQRMKQISFSLSLSLSLIFCLLLIKILRRCVYLPFAFSLKVRCYIVYRFPDAWRTATFRLKCQILTSQGIPCFVTSQSIINK